MKKILIVFGTRPEAIKMAPVVKGFLANKSFETKVCVTAQHREMLDQVLTFFDISPDYDLNLMKKGQDLYDLTGRILSQVKEVLKDFEPDYVFVHGDTTTSMAVALAGFYFGTKVCHVEAGLRTYDKKAPFPEEINRQITGRIADYHFAPTPVSKQNLIKEGVESDHISITGNTVIDALYMSVKKVEEIQGNIEIDSLSNLVDDSKDLILVTGHRRENFGDGFLSICRALKRLADNNNVQVIYPVHMNPNVQGPVYEILSSCENVHLINPLSYPAFVWLMSKAKIIITDSGGVQEEAPSLGKPVLVMRDVTERPEAVKEGTVILVGTNEDKIVHEAMDLLNNKERYQNMSMKHNPYGDGNATKRIVEYLENLHQIEAQKNV